jgi:hypothetical protein
MKKKQSFWDRPWREVDQLGMWFHFAIGVIIVSVLLGAIVQN